MPIKLTAATRVCVLDPQKGESGGTRKLQVEMDGVVHRKEICGNIIVNKTRVLMVLCSVIVIVGIRGRPYSSDSDMHC